MAKRDNEEKTIVFANSGHGDFDLSAYESYHSKEVTDYAHPEELIKKAMAELPSF